MSQLLHAPQRGGRTEPQSGFHGFLPRTEVSLADARALVLTRAQACRAARRPAPVPLSSLAPAVAPVLAADAVADRDWPPFRRAMRDGYALRAAEATAPLRLAGEIRAGAEVQPSVAPGACVAIMTGAPVPPECDTVVMIEHARRENDRVVFPAGLRPGDNIAPAGSDARAGAVVAAAGRRLTPTVLAALAAAGVTDPSIFPPPKVAILATGDELVPASQAPGPSQIRNSNMPMLAAQVRRAGAEVVAERLLPDDRAALFGALDHALGADRADLIVLSGGASVGSADLVLPVLHARGVHFHFGSVRVRPGRPVLFAELDGHLYFGLPGNPLGAWLACALLVTPALRVLAGEEPEALPPATVSARLGFDYAGKPLPLDAFRPVRLRGDVLHAEAHELPYQGSADLAAAAAADAFLMIPAGCSSLSVGSTVEVVLV